MTNLPVIPDHSNLFEAPTPAADAVFAAMTPEETTAADRYRREVQGNPLAAYRPDLQWFYLAAVRRLTTALVHQMIFAAGLPAASSTVHPMPIPAGFFRRMQMDWMTSTLMNGGAVAFSEIEIGRQPFVPAESELTKVEAMGPENGTAKIAHKPSRSFDTADRPLLTEMRRLLESGEFETTQEAARAVSPKAAGGGTDESKYRRLATKYRSEYEVAE